MQDINDTELLTALYTLLGNEIINDYYINDNLDLVVIDNFQLSKLEAFWYVKGMLVSFNKLKQ